MIEFTGLWPHWLRPLWLLLLPLMAWLLWLLAHREQRSGRWQTLLPPAFHAVLLRGGQGRASRLPWIALGLAWLLAVVALLGPSWQRIEQNDLKPADPLVVMLELTPQMLASDASPNRLAQARRKLLDLLQARGDAQTAIVVYAGSAHTVVPLSDDLGTSRNLLEALKPSIMPEPGKRADLAMGKALDLLKGGAQGQGRLLLITSSLDDNERSAIKTLLGSRGKRLRILGVGNSQGAPIIQEDGTFMKDDQGAILVPRLDAAGLSQFAREVGGQYRGISLDERDLRTLGLLDGPQQMRNNGQKTQLRSWADQGHWLLLPLLLLAACAGRRGWLLCLPLLLLLGTPQTAMAFSLDDLWLRADQQGQRLLEAQRPKEAAERFSDPQWRGLALYEAGDYAAAAEQFALSDSAASLYNRGNALARSNELEAAVDAYERALEIDPQLPQAEKNKALVQQLLRQREQQQTQQQDQPDEQNRDDSDEQQQPGQSAAPTPDERQQSQGQPGTPDDQQQPSEASTPPAQPSEQGESGQPPESPPADTGPAQTDTPLDSERRQALEQWLRQIPDDPGELLRRKFWYEQQQRQEQSR
ncbi:VWA domain-containing protein [Phytopseudomonas seleniipraecipitans]|uniref:Ca-activated chloride channel family protein n=1 Tax=Phytopseudomonas seleniipraecipitans TaxID=640205 RepID=A0A1G7HZM3_9GAMM|nr:VWA domain-containing protein [Pseudomonas seleniipraecipitans]SDF05828.1 Ca-activated chloride channel family protein [Pseudomonas seleniipraecipitans]